MVEERTQWNVAQLLKEPIGATRSYAVVATAVHDEADVTQAVPLTGQVDMLRTSEGILVTGELGGSRLGRHLQFEPRLAEAQWLAAHFSIHAMIDLSDGLAGDLRHLLRAANVGAELFAPAIPISRAARQQARSGAPARSPLLAALTDGEDFELLFAVAGRDAVPLLDGWKRQFPDLALTCIGKITAEPGVTIRDRDGTRPLTEHGYTHFA